jgi:hypothetical protein
MRKYDIEKEMSSKAEFDLMVKLPPHQSIISVEEFVVTEGWTYLVQEYFKGMELQSFVK